MPPNENGLEYEQIMSGKNSDDPQPKILAQLNPRECRHDKVRVDFHTLKDNMQAGFCCKGIRSQPVTEKGDSNWQEICPGHNLEEKFCRRPLETGTIGVVEATNLADDRLTTVSALAKIPLPNKNQLETQQPLSEDTSKIFKEMSFGHSGSSLSQTEMEKPEFYYVSQLMGHKDAVTCLCYDQTGNYIFSGSEDCLVKVWNTHTGSFYATLRGPTKEITHLTIDHANKLLAAASNDQYVWVWSLWDFACVGRLIHWGKVTAMAFSPVFSTPNSENPLLYLASTATDGTVNLWKYKEPSFNRKSKLFPKRPETFEAGNHWQMNCLAFSPGGGFLAVGSAHQQVKVYAMAGNGKRPERILDNRSHEDTINSVQWAHRGLRFISGSSDGTRIVHRYEAPTWKQVRLNCVAVLKKTETCGDLNNLKVTTTAWNSDDSLVVTACNDGAAVSWDPSVGQVVHILRSHLDQIHSIRPHPHYPSIVFSGGHDGKIIMWDIGVNPEEDRCYLQQAAGATREAMIIFEFDRRTEYETCKILDFRLSPSGQSFTAGDSAGHVLIFGSKLDLFQPVPPAEMSIHAEKDAVTYLKNKKIMVDARTKKLEPHLHPPPLLVDSYGARYPDELQRLVPGRGSCSSAKHSVVINAPPLKSAKIKPLDSAQLDEVLIQKFIAAREEERSYGRFKNIY